LKIKLSIKLNSWKRKANRDEFVKEMRNKYFKSKLK
jgi:hypothetical protein